MTDRSATKTGCISCAKLKSTLDLNQLRPDERRKILCGQSHLRGALQVDYKVVTDASQLPDGGV